MIATVFLFSLALPQIYAHPDAVKDSDNNDPKQTIKKSTSERGEQIVLIKVNQQVRSRPVAKSVRRVLANSL